jgi:hypothetical protein
MTADILEIEVSNSNQKKSLFRAGDYGSVSIGLTIFEIFVLLDSVLLKRQLDGLLYVEPPPLTLK